MYILSQYVVENHPKKVSIFGAKLKYFRKLSEQIYIDIDNNFMPMTFESGL